nr:unnamed protein product [Callosobruchus analis]
MNYWRRSNKKSRLQHVRNIHIREEMQVGPFSIASKLWFGHLQRIDDSRILKEIWDWIPAERKKRGRPPRAWRGKQLTQRRRHHHASQINADIKKIVGWGLVNKVQFNVQKTQATTLTKKSLVGLPTVEMEGRPSVESRSIKLLGTSINNNMSWHDHVATTAKTASQKLGVLFRYRKLYTPEQLLLLYKAQIRPSLEYCSHNRTVRLIDMPDLTKDLHSLDHRRRVAGLSLFCRFYHGRRSSELSQIITPKTVRTRNTREALHVHPYQVEVPTPRTSLLQHSFFWKTSTLWNEFPGSLFPDGYNLQRFKTNVTGIVGRADVLACIFFLLSLLAYHG